MLILTEWSLPVIKTIGAEAAVEISVAVIALLVSATVIAALAVVAALMAVEKAAV